MRDERLQALWKRHRDLPPLTAGELGRIVRQGMRGGLRSWKSSVGIHLLALLATIVLGLVNAAMYRDNPAMLGAELGVTLAAFALLAYGVLLARELLRIERADEPLMDALRRRLAFVRTRYELWLWAAALTTVLLVFAVTTFIDNQEGVYRINRPGVFWGALAGILLFVYGAGKLATWPAVREMRDALEDLEAGTGERIAAAPTRRRVIFWWSLVAVVILTATLILGIVVALAR